MSTATAQTQNQQRIEQDIRYEATNRQWIADFPGSSFATAEKWFNGMMGDIASLKEMPERCTLAPESEDLEREVRVLHHGRGNRTYKVYFSIDRGKPAPSASFRLSRWSWGAETVN